MYKHATIILCGVAIIFAAFAGFPLSHAHHSTVKGENPPYSTQQTDVTATWPPGAVAGGTFTARPGDQALVVDHISLPNDFTINFPEDFTSVTWRANTLEFGENCTIDLSPLGSLDIIERALRGEVMLPPPFDGPTRAFGEDGSRGSDGAEGAPGRSGISFNLIVNRVVSKGSLWIRTDGDWGATGDAGGRGQGGGGSRCKNAVNDGRDGGRGGDGGNAGDGGRGGNTAAVRVTVTTSPSMGGIAPVACQLSPCGFSARPPSATGDTGAIIIWGAPGCGGSPGIPGPPGTGGDQGLKRNCGFGLKDHQGGAEGNPGKQGSYGHDGSCTTSAPNAFAPTFLPSEKSLWVNRRSKSVSSKRIPKRKVKSRY